MFDTSINFYGKHASKIKFLASKNDSKDVDNEVSRIFKYNVDVFIVAAVWGIYYGKRAEIDKSVKGEVTINAEQMCSRRTNIEFVYRLVMLLDETENLTKEERINRAFRYDSQSNELANKNLDLFYSYVRGGVDLLYEAFCENLSGYRRIDYLYKIYERMKKFKRDINEKKEEFAGLSDDEFERQIEEIEQDI